MWLYKDTRAVSEWLLLASKNSNSSNNLIRDTTWTSLKLRHQNWNFRVQSQTCLEQGISKKTNANLISTIKSFLFIYTVYRDKCLNLLHGTFYNFFWWMFFRKHCYSSSATLNEHRKSQGIVKFPLKRGGHVYALSRQKGVWKRQFHSTCQLVHLLCK